MSVWFFTCSDDTFQWFNQVALSIKWSVHCLFTLLKFQIQFVVLISWGEHSSDLRGWFNMQSNFSGKYQENSCPDYTVEGPDLTRFYVLNFE